MRDSQRSRVYAAEHHVRRSLDLAASGSCNTATAFGSTITVPATERRFADLADVQRYVDGIRGPGQVKVRERQSNAHAHALGSREIAIASKGRSHERWAMREIVVLHEIAHTLTTGDGHGPAFAGTFMALVTEHIGAEAGFLLLSAYDGERVTWNSLAESA